MLGVVEFACGGRCPGSDESDFTTYDEWTVKKGVVYRVKCESTDKYDDGIVYTRTAYSDPF